MKQQLIGITPIDDWNERINTFMKTKDVDYFENENDLQNAVNHVISLGYEFEIYDCEAFIGGKEMEIPVLADTTKEATFLALDTFAKLKITEI